MISNNIKESDFNGYFIPIPIDDLYFSLETQEFVTFKVHDYEEYTAYRETGEVVILRDSTTKKGYKFIDDDIYYFWCDAKTFEVIYEVYENVLDYFTTDKFRKIINELYSKLLSEKRYISTMNEYMFIQRFSNISRFSIG